MYAFITIEHEKCSQLVSSSLFKNFVFLNCSTHGKGLLPSNRLDANVCVGVDDEHRNMAYLEERTKKTEIRISCFYDESIEDLVILLHWMRSDDLCLFVPVVL